ncbi:hypothetical protein M422DRAFT_251511 [Sphaerobolus stellatus SS14]|uniref:Uncharacterized protein n=1 Tax=Sphaerobolus stellatus (strain SS14) TaxID=990650 RepID=A0A0C9UPS1_SPHS4|nr:hypothetical protein M422DRAFT_251511 [Sphaerobolus stellatus SS14]
MSVPFLAIRAIIAVPVLYIFRNLRKRSKRAIMVRNITTALSLGLLNLLLRVGKMGKPTRLQYAISAVKAIMGELVVHGHIHHGWTKFERCARWAWLAGEVVLDWIGLAVGGMPQVVFNVVLAVVETISCIFLIPAVYPEIPLPRILKMLIHKPQVVRVPDNPPRVSVEGEFTPFNFPTADDDVWDATYPHVSEFCQL